MAWALESPARMQGPPLRIVQLGATEYRGGGRVVIMSLAGALSELGHRVMLVGSRGAGSEELSSSGVTVEELPWSMSTLGLKPAQALPLLASAGKFRRLLKQFRPDIVHVHSRACSLVSMLAGRTPEFFTLHNSTFTHKTNALDIGPLRRLLSPMGRRVFALDEIAAGYVRDTLHLPDDRIEIVPNGVNCDRFRPPTAAEREGARAAFGVSESETLLLYVGRFVPEKRAVLAVELLAAAKKAGVEGLRLVLVGAGDLQVEVEARIAALGLQEQCSVHGWMDPRAAYWAGDLLVMPSLFEGFPLVAVESMACGLPVLRTRAGGHALTSRDGVTGYGTEIDAAEFLKTGVEILRKRQSLAGLRDGTRQWAVDKLSIRRQAEATVAAYRRLLAGQPAALATAPA